MLKPHIDSRWSIARITHRNSELVELEESHRQLIEQIQSLGAKMEEARKSSIGSVFGDPERFEIYLTFEDALHALVPYFERYFEECKAEATFQETEGIGSASAGAYANRATAEQRLRDLRQILELVARFKEETQQEARGIVDALPNYPLVTHDGAIYRVVMPLMPDRDYAYRSGGDAAPELLLGAARIVYASFVATGPQPEVKSLRVSGIAPAPNYFGNYILIPET